MTIFVFVFFESVSFSKQFDVRRISKLKWIWRSRVRWWPAKGRNVWKSWKQNGVYHRNEFAENIAFGKNLGIFRLSFFVLFVIRNVCFILDYIIVLFREIKNKMKKQKSGFEKDWIRKKDIWNDQRNKNAKNVFFSNFLKNFSHCEWGNCLK